MSGLLNKAKDAMGKSGSSTGGQTGGAGKEDYADKGLDQIEKRAGMTQSRETNEKITDAGRGMYEKSTGSKVSDKVNLLNALLRNSITDTIQQVSN